MSIPAVVDVAEGFPGVAGTVVTVTDPEADEEFDVPFAFVAVTVKVYPVADKNPVRTAGLDEADAADTVALGVTVYPVITFPPDAGAVHETET